LSTESQPDNSSRAAERPIRVLLTAPSLDILGGQAVQAKRLLDELRREPRIRITYLPVNPRLPGPFRALQRVKYLRTIATLLVFTSRLIREALRHDVLHTFSASNYSFLLTAAPVILTGRLCGRKTIVHYHDGRARAHLAHWRTARLLLLAGRIVTPSGYLVKVFAEYGYAAQSIFNNLDLEQFPYRERTRPRPVFLHNRGLEELYNVPCTLRAFAIVQARYPEASLTIAHDGPMRAALEVLARKLELRHVIFCGKVPLERVPELYQAADIYLTSPNIDNMPGSLLECYAAGLPVVATAAGGIPLIARDEETALLVKPDDHAAMARAIFRLLEEEGLAPRLARAAFLESKRYSWQALRRQWLDLYSELARPALGERVWGPPVRTPGPDQD
jgi:glycosyltransferase involved in cell wall biosynthesis